MRCTSTLLTLLLSFSLYGQSNWETINISNWGSIKFPPSMELQQGTYKKLLDEAKRELYLDLDRVVFQQKGLNNFDNFNTYARVIIITNHANPGDLPKLNELNLSASELNELNSIYKDEVISVSKKMSARLLNWTPLKITNLNGINCLYFNYTRQIGDKPSTFSEFYIFYNYNKQHSLNIEYRTHERLTWETILNECKQSFKFKN